MAEIAYSPLPEVFCVETMYQQRNGYAYIYSTLEQRDGVIVTILRPHRHQEHFFRIINDRPYVLENRSIWKNTLVRKGSGRVNRQSRWRHTGEALRYGGVDYAILKFTATTTILPKIPLRSFIPIQIENENRAVPQVPQVPQAQNLPEPVPQNRLIKTYPITTIPQHAIRAMLRDAAMQEEVCPITGDEIDITNGSVTTCFHIFDRDAIATWLAMQNSQEKCPVCNTRCIVYTLDENPPSLIVPDEAR